MLTALTAELEAALVREVRRAYDWQNNRFKDRLTAPVIVLADSEQRLGRWISQTRTLELSRTLVLERPWPEVIAVLEHEMAHQFVDEVLQIRDEPPHGPTFQRVCAERGIDARAAGSPEAVAVSGGSGGGDRVLDR